jgi:hypothetical protein
MLMTTVSNKTINKKSISCSSCRKLDHIFIRLGLAPPTPPSLLRRPVRTCMGTLPRWEPMWQYPFSSTCQRSLMAWVTEYCHIGSQRGRVPMQMRVGRPDSDGDVGGAGPSRMKIWSSPGHISCYRDKNVHSKLYSITHVATKVYVILRSFVVLTWMSDTSELV